MRYEYIRNRQHPLAEQVFFRCAKQMTPNVEGVKTKIFLATDHGPWKVKKPWEKNGDFVERSERNVWGYVN